MQRWLTHAYGIVQNWHTIVTQLPWFQIQTIPLKSDVDLTIHPGARTGARTECFLPKQNATPPISLLAHPLVCKYHQ